MLEGRKTVLSIVTAEAVYVLITSFGLRCIIQLPLGNSIYHFNKFQLMPVR